MGHPFLTPPSLLIIYGHFIRGLCGGRSNDLGDFRAVCKGLSLSLSNTAL
jgi:hypothetical protein